MKAIGRSALFAAIAMLALLQTGLKVQAQPVEPRFQTALRDLYFARWMLTHTSAVRSSPHNYQAALGETYLAIRDLDGIIKIPSYRYTVPAPVAPGGPRLHAALSYLQDADANLAPPSSVGGWERYRNGSLSHTRSAIGHTQTLINACRC